MQISNLNRCDFSFLDKKNKGREKNILELARIKYIWELMYILEGKEIPGVDNSKVLNPDTKIIANCILSNVEKLLGEKIEKIKNDKITSILNKMRNELINNEEIDENIYLRIKNLVLRIKEVNLRYKNIQYIKTHKELKIDSTTDHLTGLLNRKYMELFMGDTMEDRKRNGTNYGLIFIDIDYFKKINDNYGHITGDNVLIELANIFKEKFRGNDKVARWGGDEFTILMKGGEKKSYLDKIEKLRLFIEETLVKNVANSALKIEGNITISAGITCIKETDKRLNEVVQRADTRLYKAKNTRNTVIFKA